MAVTGSVRSRSVRALAVAGVSLILLGAAQGTSPATAQDAVEAAGAASTLAGASRPADVYGYLCYTPVGRLKTLRPSSTRTYSYDALTLQNALVYLDFPPPVPIKTDGWYGPATASAVKAYQRSRHLYVDGVVGPRTWRELRSEIC